MGLRVPHLLALTSPLPVSFRLPLGRLVHHRQLPSAQCRL
jgi:hypothetical protein